MKKIVYFFGFATLASLTVVCLFFNPKAHANATSVTDPATIGGTRAGNDVWAEFARVGVSSQLNAPISHVKVAYTSATGNNFQIAYCETEEFLSGVTFRDCNGTSQANIKVTACPLSTDETQIAAGCSTFTNINNLTDVPLPTANLSSRTGKYPYDIEVTFVNIFSAGAQDVYAFKIIASNNGGTAGFFANQLLSGVTSYPIAIQNRNTAYNLPGGGSTHEDAIKVRFRIDCASNPTDFQVHWFDADATPGSVPYNPNVAWKITNTRTGDDITSAEYAFINGMSNPTYMGGNGAAKTETIFANGGILGSGFSLNFVSGDVLEWQWTGVLANNGIQMQIPYDDANIVDPCPPPPPAGQFSCTPTSIFDLEPGDTFKVSTNLSASGGSPGDNYDYQVSLNVPGVYTGPNPFATGNITTGSSANPQTGNISVATAGVYTGTFTVSGDLPSVTCNVTVTISNKPYFRAYGGDVIVGMDPSCPGWIGPAPNADIALATIRAFNKNGTPDYRGAGVQLAAQALGLIDGFVSASQRGSSPVAPDDLTFANEDPPGIGNFDNPPCPIDYYSKHQGTNPGPNINLSVRASGSYDRNNATSLFGNVAATKHIKLYIKGNLRITNNIRYGAYSSVDDIPSLYVVVLGNIFVQANVTQLDGVFIAQPTSQQNSLNPNNGGYIYTCANNLSPPDDTGTPFWSLGVGGCRKRLSVNGSLTSLALRLFRTYGTLSSGSDTEGPDANQAETIQYGPEVWLAPCLVGNCPNAPDAYTSLPPVL